MFPYKYSENIITAGTGWLKKVNKCNNGLATMSVKFDVDGLIYYDIPLKDVT